MWIKYKTEILYCEGGEALAQVAQRRCDCPLPGSVPGQVEWGFGQPGLGASDPAHGRGELELEDFMVLSKLNHSVIL